MYSVDSSPTGGAVSSVLKKRVTSYNYYTTVFVGDPHSHQLLLCRRQHSFLELYCCCDKGSGYQNAFPQLSLTPTRCLIASAHSRAYI